MYNLMLSSGFMKDFMRENQKLLGACQSFALCASSRCLILAFRRYSDLGLDPVGGLEAARAQHDVHQAAQR